MLSAFSKQTGIFLPLLYLFHLIVILRKFKSAFLFSTIVIIAFALSLLIVNDINVFFDNVIKGVRNGVSLSNLLYIVLIGYAFRLWSGIILVVGIYLGWQFIQEADQKKQFLGWAVLFFFALATGTALKVGSGANYYTEFVHLSLLAIGIFYHQKRPKLSPLFLSLLVPLMFASNLKHLGLLDSFGRYDYAEIYKKEQKVAEYINTVIEEEEYIFIDSEMYRDRGETFLNLMLHKKVIFPQPEISELNCQNGVYDYQAFENLYKQRQLKYLVSYRPLEELEFCGVRMKPLIKETTIGECNIYRIGSSN